MYEKLMKQEYIRIAEEKMTDEMRELFPYEADIRQSTYDVICNIKVYCKEPQTPQQHHDHYMKQSESYNETANDYIKRAKHFRDKARKALKGEL